MKAVGKKCWRTFSIVISSGKRTSTGDIVLTLREPVQSADEMNFISRPQISQMTADFRTDLAGLHSTGGTICSNDS